MNEKSGTFMLLEKQISKGAVQKDFLFSILKGDQADALGLAYDLITDQERYNLISPSIEMSEAVKFVQNYYKKCIKCNFDSEWADSRFSAILDCENWLRSTWEDATLEERQSWRNWIEEVGAFDIEARDRFLELIRNF